MNEAFELHNRGIHRTSRLGRSLVASAHAALCHPARLPAHFAMGNAMGQHFELGHLSDREPLARAREDDRGFCWRDVPYAIAIALVATALALAIVFALATVTFGPPPTVQSLLAAIERLR
jgi:hypothetical protein